MPDACTAAKSGTDPCTHTLPRHLGGNVARLHLDKIGVKLTMLYDRQSAHISVPEGPSRSDQG